MIKANDLMSESRPSQVYVYAESLINLCTDLEYNHANALWKHERAQENVEYTREQYYNYIRDMKNADQHSEKLYEIMEYQEREAESLYDASEKGLKYFLGLDTQSNEIVQPFEI
jgi:hypothetical protein